MKLSRERLHRIQRLLARHAGALSIRDFLRSYGVHRWEIEEAAALGWIEIETRKPRTGRPSPIVREATNIGKYGEVRIGPSPIAREASKPSSAKLPPWRSQIEKPISTRHFLFAIHSLQAVRRGSSRIFKLCCMTDAYQRTYGNAINRRAASASVSRLLRHPDVLAARAWFRAQINGKLPIGETMPDTAKEIWAILDPSRIYRGS